MSLGRVSFNKTQKDGVVFVYGLYQAQVGDGDSLHSFAFRSSDKYGGGMHSWAVAGSDAGGSITKILEDVYNTGKINPCITASKITVDRVKYTVSFYFEIQDSPDGKAYTGFSSWGGAGGSTSAPSGHAYDNYKKEYDAVVKKNPTVTIAIINDFWYPSFFRQVFFQYTRQKFPNLQKGAKSKKGTVGVSINQNSPPKNNDVKVLAYNPTGVQPVTSPGLSTVVFTETVAETEGEATSNEAVAEVNAVAALPVEPPVPRVPDFAPDKIFTFNVEKSQKNSPLSGFWFSPEAGTFSIVPFIPEFQFTGDEDEQLLDDEYYELGYEGSEEEALDIQAQTTPDDSDKSSSNNSNNSDSSNTNQVENLKEESIDGLEPWTRKLSQSTPGTTWEVHAANYISLKEGFGATAKWDVNHYRMGYGSEKIKKGGVLLVVKEGDTCTKKEAIDTLADWGIPEFSKQIKKDLGATYWDKLGKYQKAALVSLGYNVGAYYITSREYGKNIKKAILKGDYKAAAKEILNGPRSAKGVVLSGLVTRRKEEAQLFLLPDNKSIYG